MAGLSSSIPARCWLPWLSLLAANCGGDAERHLVANAGGVQSTGGSTSQGGESSSGGTRSTVSTSTTSQAGSSMTGGRSSTGGTPGVGGSPSIGGSPNTGGAPSSGGMNNTGGTSSTNTIGTGGSLPSGGTTSTGGTQSTGGAIGTGGTQSTGGTIGTAGTQSTGGAIATGGTQSTGGTIGTAGSLLTGGTTSTGGIQSTGGTAATGGTLGTGVGGTGTSGGCASVTHELLQNPNFDLGDTSWHWTAVIQPYVHEPSSSGAYAQTSPYLILLGGSCCITNAYIYQTVTMPADMTSAVLSFYYQVRSSKTTQADTMTAFIADTIGTRLVTLLSLSNLDKSTVWTQFSTTLDGSYAGRTFEIRFMAYTDDYGPTAFYIDTASLLVTECQ